MQIFQNSIEGLYNIVSTLDKAIVVGADGTGKTTLIKKAVNKRVFKFGRENVDLYFHGDKQKLLDNYDVFDRHPIIDYTLYNIARDNNVSINNVHTEVKSLDLFNNTFVEDIEKYKNIIWLRKPKINVLEKGNRDPDWVKKNLQKIYSVYESFFFELKQKDINVSIYEEI